MPAQSDLSVIIPVRNRRRFLREAVSSLLAEDTGRGPIEILIVDDGSEDDSTSTVSDLPVKTIRIDGSRGIAHARNVGIAASSGAFLTFLDSDDRLVPGSLGRRRAWLEDHPSRLAVAERIGSILDDQGNIRGDALEWLYPTEWVPPRRVTLSSWRRSGTFFFPSWSILFRREILEKLGGFDESLEIAVERELAFRLLRIAEVDFLPSSAVDYRWHSDNVSLRPDPRNARGFSDHPKSLAERFLIDASQPEAFA